MVAFAVVLVVGAARFREQSRIDLESSGHTVADASTLEGAVPFLRETDFDTVLIKLGRCGEAEIEALRAIRALAPDAQLLISAETPSFDASSFFRELALDIVASPAEREALLSSVARAVERRRMQGSNALYQATRAILDQIGSDRLPEVIGEMARRAMNADDVSLMLPDQRGKLYVAWSNGLSEETIRATRVSVGERVAGRAALEHAPMILQNPGHPEEGGTGRIVRSSIVYPLFAGQRLVGVLNLNRVVSEKRFGEQDLHNAAIVASQIVLALENSRLMRHLAESDRLATIGQLSAGVAHEINNPAAYVIANLQLLGKALSGNPARLVEPEYLAELRAAASDGLDGARRIEEIVRDMRSVGRKEESSTGYDLNATIHSAVRLTALKVRPVARIELELASGLEVQGSAGRMTQVFVNLLSNAADSIQESPSRFGTIRVTSRRIGSRVVVDVRDDGVGIASESLSRLFQPFFTTKPEGSGMGIGLSISRDIVRRQGGEIYATSPRGEGATFQVILPGLELRRAETETGSAILPSRKQVLCIDDEPAMGRAYRRMLGSLCDVTAESSGSAALEILLERDDFDAILCDLAMPGISGQDLFERILARRPHLAPRFVFVTAALLHPSSVAFLEGVPNRSFAKPVDTEQLLNYLRGFDRTGR